MSSFCRSHESDRVSAFRLCSKTWLLMKFLLSSMLLMFIVLVELVASIIFKVIGFVEDKDSLPVEEEFADLFKLWSTPVLYHNEIHLGVHSSNIISLSYSK